MKTITLETKNTTYQIGVTEHGHLLHLYYGPKAAGDMSCLLTHYDRGYSGNPYEERLTRTFSLDALPLEYPCYGSGDFRSPSLNIRSAEGVHGMDLRFVSEKRVTGKYSLPGLPAVYAGDDEAVTVEILLRDQVRPTEVVLRYGVLPELDVITRSVEVRNSGSEEIGITRIASACLDFASGSFDVIHFHGRHAMERQFERVPLAHADFRIGSLRGASSHQHNPFVILAQRGTTEDAGLAYGMMFVYSGDFFAEAGVDQYGQTRIQMGLAPDMFDYTLRPGESFTAPEVVMIAGEKGLAGLSHKYHRLIREHICRGPYRDVRRPILINNWEATYFRFTGEKLIAIAKQAAELGVEMMVLDDGWFGKRDSDNSGLGDWHVNEQKLGMPLRELSAAVHGLGMKFGLWIEPEMVNEDSDLYREHPDYCFMIPGKKPVMSRNQLVLDFSRREVVDCIYEQIAGVIRDAGVDYIKMDMNRSLHDIYTPAKGRQNFGEIMHRYVLGVYDFLSRLEAEFPDMLIEGCCGGGGRFDAGMLYYTPQIWCSDDTDAVERTRIQYGTSFGYPVSAMGAHVSAVPNHQTGRRTPIETRAAVAMSGTFGYELDLALLSEEEKESVKAQIRFFKEHWELIHRGDYYRLSNPFEEERFAAWSHVSGDKDRCLLFAVATRAQANGVVPYVCARGLDPEAMYEVRRWLPGVVGEEKAERFVLSGSALMHMGIPVPLLLREYYTMVCTMERVNG